MENFFILGNLYPEFFLTTSFLILITLLVIYDYKSGYKINLLNITMVCMVWVLLLTIFLLANITGSWLLFWDLVIINDFTTLIKIISLITILILIVISSKYMSLERIYFYEYFILVGCSLLGLFTLISANDLITLYLGIELQSLSFYILAAIKIYSNFSTEAGLKYFVLGAFSSGLLLLGCSLLYGIFGTTNFLEIVTINKFLYNVEFQRELVYYYDSEALINEVYYLFHWNWDLVSDINFKTTLLALIFIIIALLFKIGAAPFHMWLPDVYEGVPTIITAIFAILPKITLFSVFCNIGLSLFAFNYLIIKNLLIFSAILSILVGVFGALYQTKIKRLLAYSSISHVGFLLIGYCSFNNFGFFSLFFYLIMYMIMSLNIFVILLVLRRVNSNLKFKKINELVLLFKSNPILALNFSLVLFSIAGIPPLLGFYSKLYIFISAMMDELYLVVVIAALLSVVASLYYIRLIKLMFFKIFDYWYFFIDLTKFSSIIISFLCLFNVFFFCFPQFIVLYIYNITWYLFL